MSLQLTFILFNFYSQWINSFFYKDFLPWAKDFLASEEVVQVFHSLKQDIENSVVKAIDESINFLVWKKRSKDCHCTSQNGWNQ